MNPFFYVCAGSLALLSGVVLADPVPQSNVAFTAGASGTWNADWNGVNGRTYFIQWSLDLVQWSYAPFIDFGAGTKSRGMHSTSNKFFLRLIYSDMAGIQNQEAAEKADFDGDGLSNLFEVEVSATSPIKPDTDDDLISDSSDFAAEPVSGDLQVFTPLQ